MLTVKITYKDGSVIFKDCRNIDTISLLNVVSITIIRDEREKAA